VFVTLSPSTFKESKPSVFLGKDYLGQLDEVSRQENSRLLTDALVE
jgi:hypothetical protein